MRHGQCGQQGGRQTGRWGPLTQNPCRHTRHIPVSQGLIKLYIYRNIYERDKGEREREREREGQRHGQCGQQGGRLTHGLHVVTATAVPSIPGITLLISLVVAQPEAAGPGFIETARLLLQTPFSRREHTPTEGWRAADESCCSLPAEDREDPCSCATWTVPFALFAFAVFPFALFAFAFSPCSCGSCSLVGGP